MRVLVTGATGFVGRHLVPSLARDHEIACLVRPSSAPLGLGEVTAITADLTQPSFVERLPAGIDVIVHLAQAYLPFPDRAADLFGVNAASTHWLAEYARQTGVSRFVLASSGSVYQPARTPLTEAAPTIPPAYHPTTKLISELILDQYGAYFSRAVLRLFAPYGPGQVDRLIPRMIDSVRAGTPVMLSRGGEPRINPIHVDDLVRVVTQAVTDTRSYTVNVAGPRAVNIRELAEMIGRLVEREPNFVERDGEGAGDFVADTTLMHDTFEIGAMVPLERGLQSMIGAAAPSR